MTSSTSSITTIDDIFLSLKGRGDENQGCGLYKMQAKSQNLLIKGGYGRDLEGMDNEDAVTVPTLIILPIEIGMNFANQVR